MRPGPDFFSTPTSSPAQSPGLTGHTILLSSDDAYDLQAHPADIVAQA
ncbi:MAG TPA: hypothetical protein VHZ55_18380 [Bryobacteraceae bacterium]|nr:hypothetical protein [Bryobacteraceae bacterium]